jgi:hypothetical protein
VNGLLHSYADRDDFTRYRRLKNCTARSCFSAAAREANVPRFRRFPVFFVLLTVVMKAAGDRCYDEL